MEEILKNLFDDLDFFVNIRKPNKDVLHIKELLKKYKKEAINYSQCCKSDSEQLVCGCGNNKPVIKEPAYIHCTWCDRTYVETN